MLITWGSVAHVMVLRLRWGWGFFLDLRLCTDSAPNSVFCRDLIEVGQLRDFNDTRHRNWGTDEESCVHERVHTPGNIFPRLQPRLISLVSLWLRRCLCRVYFCPPSSKVPHRTFYVLPTTWDVGVI